MQIDANYGRSNMHLFTNFPTEGTKYFIQICNGCNYYYGIHGKFWLQAIHRSEILDIET